MQCWEKTKYFSYYLKSEIPKMTDSEKTSLQTSAREMQLKVNEIRYRNLLPYVLNQDYQKPLHKTLKELIPDW